MHPELQAKMKLTPPANARMGECGLTLFKTLVNQWQRETSGVSSTSELTQHPAYQQIIAMGEAVVPLLLQELQNKSGQWFGALKAITHEDPVPPCHRGQTQQMIKFWLDWGKSKGYQR